MNCKVYNKQSRQIIKTFGNSFCSAKVKQRINISNPQRVYKLIRRDRQLDRKMGKAWKNSRKEQIHTGEHEKDRKNMRTQTSSPGKTRQTCSNEVAL